MGEEAIEIDGESYTYYTKRPPSVNRTTRILALIHPGNSEAGWVEIRNQWSEYAGNENLLIVTPIFDSQRFEGGGGYNWRGLYGKYIGADQLLIEIAKKVADQEGIPKSMYLFGHSAAGMFTARFAVRHPRLLIGSVVEAAGRFAYPKNVGWSLGWNNADKFLEWEDGHVNKFTVEVDQRAFLTASMVPITVLVGENDTLPWVLENEPEATTRYRTHYEGQVGTDPMTIGEAWVVYMQLLATRNRLPSNIQFVSARNATHDSSDLLSYAQNELIRPFIVSVTEYIVRSAPAMSRAFGDFGIARKGQLEIQTVGGWSATLLFVDEEPNNSLSTYDPDSGRLLLVLPEALMAPCLSTLQSQDAYLRIYPHAPHFSMLYNDSGRLHVLPPKRVG